MMITDELVLVVFMIGARRTVRTKAASVFLR